jgi:hypothetical protein
MRHGNSGAAEVTEINSFNWFKPFQSFNPFSEGKSEFPQRIFIQFVSFVAAFFGGTLRIDLIGLNGA